MIEKRKNASEDALAIIDPMFRPKGGIRVSLDVCFEHAAIDVMFIMVAQEVSLGNHRE